MTNFYKIVEDGFIAGFGTNGNESATAITEDEYNDLVAFFWTRPAAPSGKAYIMRDNPREWVLIDVPPEPEPGEEEATAEDYEEALEELGVSVRSGG